MNPSTVAFSMVFESKFKSTYIMNIFLELWENILVFLSLLCFSVLVMYASMERLYAAKFAALSMESNKFSATC